jgi:hypothetical protein
MTDPACEAGVDHTFARVRRAPFRARLDAVFFFFDAFVFRSTRSGSRELPVSRFHSSNVCAEILPATSNCANFLRCAWLLNGM